MRTFHDCELASGSSKAVHVLDVPTSERNAVVRRVSRSVRLMFAVVTVAACLLFTVPIAAIAHPLGNFTVNRYARIEPSAKVVRITYVLDQAEIPTFQEQQRIDAGAQAFAEQRADEITSNLHLTVDNATASLQRSDLIYSQPMGQGGLRTFRLAMRLEAAAPNAGVMHRVEFTDGNDPDRIGWREIVVAPQGNALVEQATVPSHDVTSELLQYPKNLVQAPLDERRASFEFDPGTIAAAPGAFKTTAVAAALSGDSFVSLIHRRDLGAAGLVALFFSALVFGMAHALAPGHGKSIMAAYLVGTRGRSRDAVALGLIVAVMHTLSVLVLGAVLLWVSSTADWSKLYPMITALSGVTVAAVGVTLLVRSVRQRRRQAEHTHDHHHAHKHGHSHHHGDGGHAQGHTHELDANVAPLSRRGLYVLATSGGLLPSPSAVIVLIAAVSLHRALLGLGLIATFSFGLAATLSVIGLALVQGRSFLDRRNLLHPALVRLTPMVSGTALIFGGSLMSAGAFGAHL